jgi:SPX domain protein involved in polyphosphate accumulation
MRAPLDPASVVRFPYAVLEVKLASEGGAPEWIEVGARQMW